MWTPAISAAASWPRCGVSSPTGGSLVLFGGGGGFAGTPVARALPVTLGGGGKVGGTFSLSVTGRGQAHPVFSGFSVAGLPALDAAFAVGSPKPAATVLATGGGRPVIVGQPYGRGKSLVIAAEGFWHWDFGGGGHTPYTKFWGQALRWLYTPKVEEAPPGQTVQLYPLPKETAVGSTVALKVAVYQGDYSPDNQARPAGQYVAPNGRVRSLAFTRIPGGQGAYEASFLADQSGEYRVAVAATKAGLNTTTQRAKFAAKERELIQAGLNEELLRQLAVKSGGKYFPVNEAENLASQIPEQKVQKVHRRQQKLWTTPWLFLAFVALLTGEWILRKRNQLA